MGSRSVAPLEVVPSHLTFPVKPIFPNAGLSPVDVAALRSIAVFEVIKAALVLGAGVASLFLLRHDLHGAAIHALRHLHMDPASRISLSILQMALRVQEFDARWIAFGSVLYTIVRLSEAYGLWYARAWGEWIGALSGAIYLPVEIREAILHASAFRVGLLAANLAVVLFLCRRLWKRRHVHVRISRVDPKPELDASP